MPLSIPAATLIENARLRILSSLEAGGPMTVADLPRRWPETRLLVRQLLDELAEAGEVARVVVSPVTGRPGWRITPRGRSRLRGCDEAAD